MYIALPLKEHLIDFLEQQNMTILELVELVDMGKVGSGANSTWMYLGELDKDFKNPSTRNLGDDMGLSAIISGQTDLMLQMQNKSIDNKLVKDVLSNKQLKFVPMQAWSFNDKLPNGAAVYTKETISIRLRYKWRA